MPKPAMTCRSRNWTGLVEKETRSNAHPMIIDPANNWIDLPCPFVSNPIKVWKIIIETMIVVRDAPAPP